MPASIALFAFPPQASADAWRSWASDLVDTAAAVSAEWAILLAEESAQ
ncbi:hypothetical protein [Microbacterium sp. NIBRBAC000506063]|nr:hypothetical protein [Microbacterium sp. NIBRBAC000506063]QTV79079.1 hypothetical protein KAE78_08020 [Microbacterium sp. NIBRBAC000506063]